MASTEGVVPASSQSGERPGRVELLTGIESTSSRPGRPRIYEAHNLLDEAEQHAEIRRAMLGADEGQGRSGKGELEGRPCRRVAAGKCVLEQFEVLAGQPPHAGDVAQRLQL